MQFDFSKVKPESPLATAPTNAGKAMTFNATASFCLILCGVVGIEADDSGVYLMLGYRIGKEFGGSTGVGGGPGSVTRGGSGVAECSWGLAQGSIDSNGTNSSLSAGINLMPLKAGCSSGADYVF